MADSWLAFGRRAWTALVERARSRPQPATPPTRRGADAEEAACIETDSLTGLLTRDSFEQAALPELARRRFAVQWSGVLRIEIDRVAELNETLGHAAGDELLRLAAERLTLALGPGARLARLGGAAFVALSESGDRDVGAKSAAAVVEAMSQPFDIDGLDAMSAAKVGVALAPADGEDLPQLLRRAEIAQLRARQEGGGAWRRFEAALDHVAQAKRELRAALAEARAQGRLLLHYQPIVEVATGRVKAFEALLRWRHPTLGLVGAHEFIPLAEESGLIVSLGQWALEAACREALRWPEGLTVAVNVSPLQLRAGGLPGDVDRALSLSGLRPSRLEVEVTEGVLIGDRDFARHELDRLRELGVGVALDDFGSGYASFGYLCSFPFSKLKIDQSFLREMTDRPNNAVVIKSIATLAADLKLLLVVEGVDSAEQREWLIANGCTLAQGYYFGRPMPAEDIPAFLKRRAEAGAAAA